jgi:hypothetical protein
VSFIVLLSGIPAPRIAVIGISVIMSYLSLAALYHVRHEHHWMWLIVAGAILALLHFDLFGNRPGFAIGVYTLVLVMSDLHQGGDEPRLRRALMMLIALGLVLSLFSPVVAIAGAGVWGLTAGTAAVFGLRPYRRVGLVALIGFLLVACLSSFRGHPEGLIAAGSVPLLISVIRPGRLRLSADTLFAVLFFALLAAAAYRDTDTGWYFLHLYAPGASAVRALGRVVLVMLFAWAIGLGLFVDAMVKRRRPIAATLVTLVCLLEQGMTTPSYDKQLHRTTIAALARRIDRRDAAFFYSPHSAAPKHLDAMWAGLESGVPTINGYSGNMPRGWGPLEYAMIQDECAYLCLESSLRRWVREHGLPLNRIGWIGGLAGWRGEGEAQVDRADSRVELTAE